MDMDISMDIHVKSVDMDMDMDVKFHIHGNPVHSPRYAGTLINNWNISFRYIAIVYVSIFSPINQICTDLTLLAGLPCNYSRWRQSREKGV